MMKIFTKFGLLLVFVALIGTQTYAQPACGTVNAGTLTPTTTPQTLNPVAGSSYYWDFNATAGNTYTFNSCLSLEDTYIRIYDASYAQVAYNDDNGVHCTGTRASIDWLATGTGTFYVSFAHYSCNPLTSDGDLEYYYTAAPTYPVLTPGLFCQVEAGSFAAAGNVTYELNLLAANTYDFSLCINDLCCGGTADDFDGDFTMYNSSFVQQWYIDGAGSCGYDASTIGTIYENWSPPSDGVYYLQIDDYYNGAGNFELAYIMGGAVQLGTPTATCTTTSGAFAAGEGVFHEFYLYPTEAYNFSCCNLDACGGTSTGDMDFYMIDNNGIQLFYIDGNSSCGWNATTYGSAYENFIPAAEGCYYLYVTDYYGGAASFDLSYISAPLGTLWTGAVDTDWSNTGNWSSGLPAVGDDVILNAGLPNYPVIDGTYACNGLTINAGASFTVATGGDFTVGADLTGYGAFVMNDGTCTIVGDLNNADAANALVDINGGTLNIGGGWYEIGFFTFARGSFQLSGGTINVTADVAWYDVNATSLMNGPFTLTIGGTFQSEAGIFASITDGTVVLTGDGYILSPSSLSAFTVYNLTIAGGDHVASRDAENNPFNVLNDFNIVGGSLTTLSDAGTGKSSVVTVGGNCTVGIGGDLTADVLTAFNVTGTLATLADAPGYGSFIDNSLTTALGGVFAGIYMTGPQWHTISAPVAGIESGLFTGLYLQNFDEPSNTWMDIIPTNVPLTPGVGFAFYSPITVAAGVPGPYFNSGTITNSSLTRSNLGWNMVGNPYPSPIDWDAVSGWTKTNVADALYVEDNGAWASYVGGVGTGNGSNLVAPGQGFFVECTNAAGGTLGFTNAVRTHNRVPYFKSDVADIVRVKVEGNSYSDDMVIRFLDDATEGFDYDFDAHKMFAYNVEMPQIYSMANGYMSINTLPATKMVPTGFRSSIPGQFTISAVETSDFSDVILEDLVTGEQTNLLTNSYTFTSSVDDNEDRFIIHFTPLAVPENSASDLISIYSYHNNVYVSVPENTNGNIVVYNVSGQVVANANITGTLNVITLDESAFYIVKVQGDNSVTSEKVFVK
ncbi:MAG: T9SS type A sorting domain-containing protein [Bacteroidales bacterium]